MRVILWGVHLVRALIWVHFTCLEHFLARLQSVLLSELSMCQPESRSYYFVALLAFESLPIHFFHGSQVSHKDFFQISEFAIYILYFVEKLLSMRPNLP